MGKEAEDSSGGKVQEYPSRLSVTKDTNKGFAVSVSLDSAKRIGIRWMSWIEWASDWSGPVGRGSTMFPYKGLIVNMFILVSPVSPAAVRA